MRILVLLSFFLFASLAQGQVFINGFVQDSLGNPARHYVNIEQKNISESKDSLIRWMIDFSSNGNYYSSNTNRTGSFHLLVDTTLELSFLVKSYGFISKEIKLDDLSNEPIIVILEQEPEESMYTHSKIGRKPRPTELLMGIEFLEKKFETFNSILGKSNVKQLDNLPLTIEFNFAKNYKRIFTGVSFGVSFNDKRIGDTLHIEANQTLYAFQLGYKIIDRKKIVIMPLVSTKLYRIRLINGQIGDKISLPNYINDKDLDIRFLQPIADFGISMAYKYQPKRLSEGSYLAYGIYGGYPIKMRNTPRINGLRSTLETDRSIEIGDFSLGIFFRTFIK